MPTFTNIDIEESATVTARVASVQIARGSTNEEQEILCLGDPDSSLAIAAVTGAAPLSTRQGLNVRIVSGPSSVADLAVRAVLPSTIGDNLVSAQQNSTTWAVQVDGRVRAQNSTIGDLLASVQQNSTVWAIQADGRLRAQNSTIGDFLASVQQNSTVWQTQARPVLPTMESTTQLITSTHSTAVYEVKSSAAGLKQKVYAYVVGSTHTNPSTLLFMSSLAIDRYHVPFGSGSSGITGANLAVTPPGFLFETVAANALNVRIEGGSSVTATCVARISVSFFSEA